MELHAGLCLALALRHSSLVIRLVFGSGLGFKSPRPCRKSSMLRASGLHDTGLHLSKSMLVGQKISQAHFMKRGAMRSRLVTAQ
jgi:2-polyprenyl-6-methoxyphenol hydroxylase-like FAD-dependent oxidoreductase